jgi:cytochrome b561
LMAIRFVVRVSTAKPADATTGYPLLDRIAPISHYGFYFLVLVMVGTGFATAILSGLNIIVFGPAGAPLPPTLMIFPTFVAHTIFATLLADLVTLHVLAALYHQFVRNDGLFQRMFIGQRE